jgi:O-antigen/teichoic acid export membrane protein
MINRLKPKSEFSKNVLTLMTGTTIAQAIPIAISPILTRIYSPEDFGIFALYMSMAIILSVLVSGRYELAIILPDKDEDAFVIMILSMIITSFLSFFIFIGIIFFNKQITSLLGNTEISMWLYFIPITLFLTGIYQNLNYWNNRKKKYKRLASNRIIQSGVVSSTNLGLGFSGFGSSGLILGNIIGQGIATVNLGRKTLQNDTFYWQEIRKGRLLQLAKKYSDFPKFSIASDLFTVFNSQLSIFFISKFFTLSSVGFFSFVLRVISIPTAILSSAVGDVFKQQASKHYAIHQECKHIYLKTLKRLFILGVLPFILLFVYAPQLFMFVFGDKWHIAGEYAQLLMPMFFLQFISSPLSVMFYIAEKQSLYLKITIVVLLTILSLFVLAYGYKFDMKTFLVSYTIIYCILYIVNLFITYNLSKEDG